MGEESKASKQSLPKDTKLRRYPWNRKERVALKLRNRNSKDADAKGEKGKDDAS